MLSSTVKLFTFNIVYFLCLVKLKNSFGSSEFKFRNLFELWVIFISCLFYYFYVTNGYFIYFFTIIWRKTISTLRTQLKKQTEFENELQNADSNEFFEDGQKNVVLTWHLTLKFYDWMRNILKNRKIKNRKKNQT